MSARFGAPKFQPIIQLEDQREQELLAPLLTQEARGSETKPPILYPIRKLRNSPASTLDDNQYLENSKRLLDKFSYSGFYSGTSLDQTKSYKDKFRLMIGMRDIYDELDLDSAESFFPKELSRFFAAKRRKNSHGDAVPVSAMSVSLSSLSATFEARAKGSRLDQLNNVIKSLSATATSLQPHEDIIDREVEQSNTSKEKEVKEKEPTTQGDDDEEEDPVSDEFAYDDDDDDSGDDYTTQYGDGDDGDDDDFGDDDDEGVI